MKKYAFPSYLFTLLLVLTLFACNQSSSDKGGLPSDIVKNPNSATGDLAIDMPVIEFDKDFYDFGKIIQGEKVSYSFKFKNTGKSDLIISKVTTSCGCTAGDYPRVPVKPGESGNIEVKFDSESRRGFQNKTVTVLSNAQPSTNTLRIKAQVVLPEEI
jgi:hypothetical protein